MPAHMDIPCLLTNNRLRPAEVLIDRGESILIRRQDTLDDLLTNFIL